VRGRRVILAIVIAAVVLASGFAARREIAVRRAGDWVEVKKDDLAFEVEVTGQLVSVETALLGPPQVEDVWQYKIAMLATEGDDVKAGAPVLAFDTDQLQRELQEKIAEADSARKEIEKRRADLALNTRDEELKLAEAEARLRKAEMKLLSPEDLSGSSERKEIELDRLTGERESKHRRERLSMLARSAEEQVHLLQAKLDNAARRVDQIRSGIAKMTVRAPADGTIVYVSNWRGEKKKVGDTCWIQEKVIEIPDLKRMRGEGEVDEADAGRVTVGQKATLRLDALPDEDIPGRVVEIGRTVQRPRGNVSPTKVLNVRLSLENVNPEKMRPGMRFQGTLETGRVEGVVVAPVEAFRWSGGEVTAEKRTPFGSQRTAVKLGRRSSRFVEVVEGLEPGDRILVPKAADEEETP
jgi:HlyD family secretion protein